MNTKLRNETVINNNYCITLIKHALFFRIEGDGCLIEGGLRRLFIKSKTSIVGEGAGQISVRSLFKERANSM